MPLNLRLSSLLVGVLLAFAVTPVSGCKQKTCDDLKGRLRLRLSNVPDNPLYDPDLTSPADDRNPSRCVRLEPEFHSLPEVAEAELCDASLDCFGDSECLADAGSTTGFACGGPGGNPCDPMQCPGNSVCRAAPGTAASAPEFRCRPGCTPICPAGGTCDEAGFRCSDTDGVCSPNTDCPAGETCDGTTCSDGVTPCDPDSGCATGSCAPFGRCSIGNARCDLGNTVDTCIDSGTVGSVCLADDDADLRAGGWCDNPNGPVCMRILRHMFGDPLGLGRDFCPECEEYELAICDCKSGPALFQCLARWSAFRELRTPPDTTLERRVCRVTLQSFMCEDVLASTLDDFGNTTICGDSQECVGGRCIALDPGASDPAETNICSGDCTTGADCPDDLFTDWLCAENARDRFGACRDIDDDLAGSGLPCDTVVSGGCPDGERCLPYQLPPVCVPNDDTLVPHAVGEVCDPQTPFGCEPFTCYRRPDNPVTGVLVGICSVRCESAGDPECPDGYYCSIDPVHPERGPFCNRILGFGAPCAQYGDEADVACASRCVERTPDPTDPTVPRFMCSFTCAADADCTDDAMGDFCRRDAGLMGTGESTPFCDSTIDIFDPCSPSDMAPNNACAPGDVCAMVPSGDTLCTRSCDPMGGNNCPGTADCVDDGMGGGLCDPDA